MQQWQSENTRLCFLVKDSVVISGDWGKGGGRGKGQGRGGGGGRGGGAGRQATPVVSHGRVGYLTWSV